MTSEFLSLDSVKKIHNYKQEIDYYKSSRDELIESNTKLREEKLFYKTKIDQALKILKAVQFFTTPIGQVIHLNMEIDKINDAIKVLENSNAKENKYGKTFKNNGKNEKYL